MTDRSDPMTEHERLSELALRRGFFFPSNEPYGGTAGFYTYGPQGAAIKDHVESSWRDRFLKGEGHMEIQSPTVMPEAVFEASGHLDTFDDLLVECPACGQSHRADHLIEDATDIEDAEGLPIQDIGGLIAEHDIHCPNCGTPLADEPIEEFNLMFETNIGPGSSSPGYLRPETAQGIFVDFPRLKAYARNQLPFAVGQIGTAYRNEISPRRGIIRVREFTQAELEQFIDPDVDVPPLARVADVPLTLYSAEAQMADGGGHTEMTVRDAVDDGVVAEPWIAYYLGLATGWYASIGVDMDRFRYRQHLAGERSHYATDCWDAEAELGGDWVEITGFAYRGDYDLSKHDEHGDGEFTIFKQYEDPRTVERPSVDPDLSRLGPEFGDATGAIVDALERLVQRDPGAFEGEAVTVEVDGTTYSIPVEDTGFAIEETTVQGEHVMPHVVEPSFGVGRLVYTVLAHAYRVDEVDGEPRTYLALPSAIAPTFVGVFPLMDRDGLGARARTVAEGLRDAGFEVTYDDSGSIGRRYRRQDEIGTPFCVTIDYETLEEGSVTIRHRDSAAQRRVPLAELPDLLAELRDGDRDFEGIGVEVSP